MHTDPQRAEAGGNPPAPRPRRRLDRHTVGDQP